MTTIEICKDIIQLLEPDRNIEIECVQSDDEYYAYAKPTLNLIVISSAVLKLFSYDELMAVLGHELGHLMLDHNLSIMSKHKAEFEADRYAIKKYKLSRYAMIIGLYKAMRKTYSKEINIWTMCSHSHPSLLARATKLGLNSIVFEE